MKNIIFAISLMVSIFFISCNTQEDRESMGPKLKLSDLTFEAYIASDIDSNTIVLKNTTAGVIPLFDYGTGKSTNQVDTIHYSFKGKHTIYFYALSAGGMVGPDSVVFNLRKDNYSYIQDELWINISGGVGKSKTWKLDLQAKYFPGPLYFYGTNNGWGSECMLDGGDCWNWSPDYAGNTWLMPNIDYGTMTFNLIGGPYVSTVKPAEGTTESGTYYLDPNTHVLTMTGATILRDVNRISIVTNWSSYTMFSLTENSMQLAVLRDNSSEGKCLLVYNFISQDYYDSH